MGQDRPLPGAVPLRGPVRDSAFEAVQAEYPQAGLARDLADAYALARSILDHRTKLPEGAWSDHLRHRSSDRHRRPVAGVLLPQFEFAAAAARLRSFSGRGFGRGS